MNERAISALKGVRTAVQVLAEPIDSLTRFMNCKKGYPPLWVRQRVGSLNDFEGSGGEYMSYLKLLCNLEPGMNVLDVGCGCGLMCLPVNENGTLPEYLYPGSYVGIDIDEGLVDWCERHLSRENCHFFWIGSAANFKFGASHGSYDVVLCKSLFTHLFKHEVVDYLNEIRELLKPQGVCLATFFLLSDVEPKGRYSFEECEGDFSLDRYENPRAAIAYEEECVRDILDRIGFKYEVYYGSWRGDNKGLSFQDIIILRK